MAVSLCRVEDEDLLSVSFVFMSLSDPGVNFDISIRMVFLTNVRRRRRLEWFLKLVVMFKFNLSDLISNDCVYVTDKKSFALAWFS